MASELGLRSCIAAVLAAMLGCGGALAENTATVTTSTTADLVFNIATTVTNQIDKFATKLLGRLNGATVYDQNFNVAFSDPSVQAALTTVTAAVTTAGGPAVVIAAPHLVSSASATTSLSATTYSLVNTTVDLAQITHVIGPATQQTGVISSCDVSALPSATIPTCTNPGGTTFVVMSLTVNDNLNFNTNYIIDTTTNTANTTTLSEVWAVDGATQALGTVHNAVQAGAFDLNNRFLRRLGNEGDWAGGGAGFVTPASHGPGSLGRAAIGGEGSNLASWMEAYGQWSHAGAQGVIAGEAINSYGLAGGLDYRATPGLSIGFGLDHGRSAIDVGSGAEKGDLDLTQLGLNGGWRSGQWLANAALTYGFGSADTSHNVGGAATASHDLSQWGALAELGYDINLGSAVLTPMVGLDHSSLHSGAFTETGGIALAVSGANAQRTRGWIGFGIANRWRTSAGDLNISAYVRAVDILSGQNNTIGVAFASGGPAMSMAGLNRGKYETDVGAKLNFSLTQNASLFAAYDGRFQKRAATHAANLGFKVTW